MNSNLDTPPPLTTHRAVSARFLLGLILALCIGTLTPNIAAHFGLPQPNTLAVTGATLLVAILGRVILVKTSRPRTSPEPDSTLDGTDPVTSGGAPGPSWLILPALLAFALLVGGLVMLGLVAMSAMSSAPGSVGLLPMLGMGGLSGFLAAHATATAVASGVATVLGLGGMHLVPLDDAFKA